MEFDVINGKVVERRINPKIAFYHHPVLDRAASDEQGRRVYIDMEYIKIRPGGGVKDYMSRKATDNDRAEFPAEYKAFKNGEFLGTDIELIVRNVGDIANLATMNIHTVEQLAEIEVLPENLKPYRNKARAYIELIKGDDDGSRKREATG